MLGNVSHGLGSKLTMFGELWTQQNLDPAGHTQQYSFDTAAAYLVTRTLQIDIGGNFGLNRQTPGSQVYLGISSRF